MNEGWIKLHRQLLNNDIWRNDKTAWCVFETLLLVVDRNSGKWCGGRFQLCEAYGVINPSTLYKALLRLQKSKMVTLSSNTKWSTISICKWSEYQNDGNTKCSQQSNNKVTTESQQSNTLTRSKELRIKNNTISEVDKELLQVINKSLGREFRTLPHGYKKTLSLFSLEEISTALSNLSKDDWHRDKLSTLKLDYLLRDTTIDKFRLKESIQGADFKRMVLNLDTGKMEEYKGDSK